VTIEENIPIGTIIAQVQAVDKDVGLSGDVIYRFAPHTMSVHGHIFAIRNTTGVIYVTVNHLYDIVNHFWYNQPLMVQSITYGIVNPDGIVNLSRIVNLYCIVNHLGLFLKWST